MKFGRLIMVEMDYIGKVLSVNHYKYQGKYTRPEVKAWMEELGWRIKQHHIEEWKLPLIVTCSGVFKDKRSTPDLSNLSKVILDAIEDVTGINDREMRWKDGYALQETDEKPHLIISIEEAEKREIPVLDLRGDLTLLDLLGT